MARRAERLARAFVGEGGANMYQWITFMYLL
jgi:hypothetical protein